MYRFDPSGKSDVTVDQIRIVSEIVLCSVTSLYSTRFKLVAEEEGDYIKNIKIYNLLLKDIQSLQEG